MAQAKSDIATSNASAANHIRYIQAYDTLLARLEQTSGIISALGVMYANCETDHHPLGVCPMRDSLSAANELLQQAEDAAILGLGEFRPKVIA